MDTGGAKPVNYLPGVFTGLSPKKKENSLWVFQDENIREFAEWINGCAGRIARDLNSEILSP